MGHQLALLSTQKSTVRRKQSRVSSSSPNTKLPQTAIPWSESIFTISRYFEGLFCFFPACRTVPVSTDSNPMKSALQPARAMTSMFSTRWSAASDACATQCFFIGTIASGWLSDRYDARKLLCWYYALRGLSLLWLPSAEFTLYGLSLFAVFYGLDWIATVPPTVRLTAERFGAAKVGMVFGWVFAGHQIGAAVAAYGAGLSRSLLLSYAPALYVAGAACLLAAGMAMTIRRRTAAG